jgi:hypothetical protein
VCRKAPAINQLSVPSGKLHGSLPIPEIGTWLEGGFNGLALKAKTN